MHTSGQTPADRRTRNLRPSDLPPVMLADDPRLHLEPISLEDCAAENEPEGFIPLSDALLIKRSCSKNEADMLEYAGKEIAIRLVTRIGTVDTISSTFHQQSAIIERGVPCVLSEIRPEERLPTSLRIIELVSQLHARGIIHGDINPSALRWNPQGQLVFADFANARFVQDSDREQNQEQRRWDGDEEFVSPRARSNTRFGQPFVPTESDDLFAMSVTLWCVWAGRRPEHAMFSANSGPSPDLSVITDPDVLGDVIDTLQEGVLNLSRLLPYAPFGGRELSPPLLAHPNETSRSPSPMFRISQGVVSDCSFQQSRGQTLELAVELPADVPLSAAVPTTRSPQPPLPVSSFAKKNSCPSLQLPKLLEWQSEQHLDSDSNCPPQPSLSPTHQLSSNPPSPTPQPTAFDSDQPQHHKNDNSSDNFSDTSSDSDELDEEIVTWEFPFPFMQGLPCSPTDSMACLASPKGPPPPEFAVRMSPQQLRLRGHRRVQSVGGIAERMQEGGYEVGRMGRSLSNPGWGSG